jgi:hypothetical protein
MCRKTAATPVWASDDRGRAGLDKQIQAARKEREELEARGASYPLPAIQGVGEYDWNAAN